MTGLVMTLEHPDCVLFYLLFQRYPVAVTQSVYLLDQQNIITVTVHQ